METQVSENTKLDSNTINLFDVGCLANLKIGMWSGRKMLTRADLVRLGYDPKNIPEDIVNLGRKLMVPKYELQVLTQIEQRARKAIERWSVKFGIANAHFIPATMLPTVEEQIKDLKEEFNTKVDSFISRFDQLVTKVREEHPDFWDKCLKGHYPTNIKDLRGKFKFELYLFKIAGISSIEETSVEDIIANQKIRDERQEELRNKMKNDVGEFVEEYVSSMRKETMRFCDLMTARINGTPFEDEEDAKGLTPKSISCFRNYINRFKVMNIFGDMEIDKMLSEFKTTFLDSGVSPSDFESSNVKNSISKTLAAIREKAAEESSSGSQFIGELKRRVTLS